MVWTNAIILQNLQSSRRVPVAPVGFKDSIRPYTEYSWNSSNLLQSLQRSNIKFRLKYYLCSLCALQQNKSHCYRALSFRN